MMDNLLGLGALVLLKLAEAGDRKAVRQSEEAHTRRLAEQVHRMRASIVAQDAVRMRERRAALERLRLASSNPRWQERIDALLAATKTT